MNNNRFVVHTGDNLPILKTLADNSVDAIVTDPPAGIGFMGKEWDKDKGGRDKWIEWMAGIAAECLRVIKPGGHALVWALPRTSHWTATAWENAGWEPRDRICHIFGSGFPKSANISKQIDRMAGAERKVIGKTKRDAGSNNSHPFTSSRPVEYDLTAPATDAAKQWDGYGTALKPAVEDYWLFRKPIEKGLNIAQNVLKWGTGGLNIDGCRVKTSELKNKIYKNKNTGWKCTSAPSIIYGNTQGRFPAHLIHDGSEEVEAVFPVTGPSKASERGSVKIFEQGEDQWIGQSTVRGHDDQGGSASRFFYCAKPGKSERDAGLEELEAVHRPNGNKWTDIDYRVARGERPQSAESGPRRNVHPTVKALKLMTYLCRLITPHDGLILDPFTGSGSTGCAAMIEGFRFIGMEQSPEYAEIATKRIEHWLQTSVKYEVDTDEPQLSILDVIDES